ncbi:hypothetical protein ABT234_11605 [Streptomyces sp. NPDC001586]|uniref:hypothetical protein n=1 Tax=Streptomyces sp. NPDC001586 TaxID=3154387 RepID=UPI00331E1189
MTIDLASAALDLEQEWDDAAPIPFAAAAPVPPALTASEVLASEGRHVHLVAGDVQCLTHACIALPGA